MDTRDPKLIVLRFNECINNRDINGLARLMAEDHAFIDREGTEIKGKKRMIEAWKEFFALCPIYKNTFESIVAEKDRIGVTGYAYWSEDNPHDACLWTAKIENDLVAEWRVFSDSEENRARLKVGNKDCMEQIIKK